MSFMDFYDYIRQPGVDVPSLSPVQLAHQFRLPKVYACLFRHPVIERFPETWKNDLRIVTTSRVISEVHKSRRTLLTNWHVCVIVDILTGIYASGCHMYSERCPAVKSTGGPLSLQHMRLPAFVLKAMNEAYDLPLAADTLYNNLWTLCSAHGFVFKRTDRYNYSKHNQRRHVKKLNIEESLDNIALSVPKALVRQDLCHQITVYVNSIWPNTPAVDTDFRVVTLPGPDWAFERLLTNQIKLHTGLTKVPRLLIHGLEREHRLVAKALKYKPDNCTCSKNELADFFKYIYSYDQGGVLLSTGEQRSDPLQLQLLFADFCQPFNLDMLAQLADIIANNISQGLCYFTCKLASRDDDVDIATLIKPLRPYTDAVTAREAVLDTLNCMIRQRTRKPVHLVYNVKYGGGGIGNVAMLAAGYLVGVKLPVIESTVQDRMEESKLLVTRNATAATRMSRVLGAWVFEPCYPRAVKLKPCKHDARQAIADEIIKSYAESWILFSPAHKQRIATKLGVTVQQIGSIIGQHHRHDRWKLQKTAV